ncbi:MULTISPECIES: helix-turn-helix transcriptional regulator [unclassified Sphingomonas]|uniref:helix-turn-helix domain-containing protein n=1 Tax=unclassified Sphingomonas TaxID=196159 RepID=UPI00226AF716|nr:MULTISPECIES: helix-turn-helix transcriptional regulator [unclassified Sphingomonas]
MITHDQCRAARILAGMSAVELAKRAKVGIATVKRFESGQSVTWATLGAIHSTLMAAGIAFIAAGDMSLEGGEGVRIAPTFPE